ncbi:unnamed protein product [Staurois parvus]|uniref:Uncharacterized protein n=1 Tax=Staurois parvus TaxID=386267 RepID=A0ABN9BPR6_9NEOB|nr:unnamed protein product [Staurois parvus]
MSLFDIFKFPAGSVPHTSRRRRERNLEDGCRHRLEDITGDTAGGTSRDKVSKEEIPEQRCSVFPTVARGGYRLWC